MAKFQLNDEPGPYNITLEPDEEIIVNIKSSAHWTNDSDRWTLKLSVSPGKGLVVDLSGSTYASLPRFTIMQNGAKVVPADELLKTIADTKDYLNNAVQVVGQVEKELKRASTIKTAKGKKK